MKMIRLGMLVILGLVNVANAQRLEDVIAIENMRKEECTVVVDIYQFSEHENFFFRPSYALVSELRYEVLRRLWRRGYTVIQSGAISEEKGNILTATLKTAEVSEETKHLACTEVSVRIKNGIKTRSLSLSRDKPTDCRKLIKKVIRRFPSCN